MKVLILAGGLGTRLKEETTTIPKPMVEIGDKPILWHIMKIYSHYGFNDFVVLGGYKQEIIKRYFFDYDINNCDVMFHLGKNSLEIHYNNCEQWNVYVKPTGLSTMTAGRIKRAQDLIGKESFMLTYGDGVADIDINALIHSHKKSGKLCTLTAYQPSGRFGVLRIQPDGTISSFSEKPKQGGAWINAGFMVCEPGMFDYFPENSDNVMLEDPEKGPLTKLAEAGQLNSYIHKGFWHSMDVLKDKNDLNEMWNKHMAPWQKWR